ncbi:helix-turn-helix domain-containing protein [Actinocrispum wychmicini]|uniref:Regulatory LuxR family protein n=1 Tax=Actinocrispum wychmicini TaxID=1213861 RepID=A0A4R2JZF4_9PSEU|nr:helix-turn-helix transcriptional regulator [Actinocrispum wychmicini]TCO62828.1 regulatory LuxR family protein [Actinocrispum wychmicini]
MLESLGLSGMTESVYRLMLAHPDWGVTHLAAHMEVAEGRVRECLDELADLALLRPSWDRPNGLRPVSPQVGLAALLARAESEVAERQRQIETTRAAISAIAVEHHATHDRDHVVHLTGLDQVRVRLEELACTATSECASFTPGAAQRPDTHQAGKPANQAALERGVSVRSVYQDSFRNDPGTLAYVRWLTDLGGLTRSVPTLPMMMVIIDRSVALLPVDPTDSSRGAIEVSAPGVVAAVYSLFEQVWATATPFGAPEPVNDSGLNPQELQLLKILSEGHTDEVAGRRLNLSLRTVRRMMSQIMDRLGAHSRFQAGVHAAAKGWLGTTPEPSRH